MKKILLLVFGLLVIVLGYFSYHYYTQTYQGQIAYAVVPKKVPQKVATKDDSGKIVDHYYSYNYTLTFVKTDGTQQTMPVDVSGENPQPLAPGTYVQAKISRKRLLTGPNPVKLTEIPTAIRATLTK